MAAQSRWESTLGTLKIHTNSYLSSPSAWLHLDPKPCQNRLPKTRMPHRSDCCLHFCGSSLRLITRKSISQACIHDVGWLSAINFLGYIEYNFTRPKGPICKRSHENSNCQVKCKSFHIKKKTDSFQNSSHKHHAKSCSQVAEEVPSFHHP